MLGHCQRSVAALSAANRPERHAPGLPTKGVRQHSRRGIKSRNVGRAVKGLHYVLCILTGGISPASDFGGHLTVIWIFPCVIPGEHAKHGGRLQMRYIANDKGICPISQVAS